MTTPELGTARVQLSYDVTMQNRFDGTAPRTWENDVHDVTIIDNVDDGISEIAITFDGINEEGYRHIGNDVWAEVNGDAFVRFVK